MPQLAADRPTVPQVLPLVRALYSGAAACTRHTGRVGGHLHIALDDGNLSDGAINYCLDEAILAGCATCADIARQMLAMSITQRTKLYRSH